MIRYAKKGDEAAVLNLFNICFPNEEAFAEYFFKNHFSLENTLVDEESGVIRGSAMVLPYYIEGVGEVSYLYAVGTLPEFRGKGICGNILIFSHKEDIKNNRRASILIPGSKELFGFYERLGYKKAAFLAEEEFTTTTGGHFFKTKECRPSDLVRLYESALDGRKFIKRSEKYFEGQIKLFKAFGGGCLGLYDNDRLLSCCFYSVENSELKFEEILGEKREILAGEILKKFNLPRCAGKTTGAAFPFGMAYFYGEEFDFYMNLMFN